ncbi:hypothetical protein M0R04_08345 [Candidatus Dojkabacteria bacterium]|jgi:hypothetical protein|nr:hypothetical protein [Candidatus Dojkabacteria bacterium]
MFNKVIIKNVTEQKHNIHLAVHPFRCDYFIKSFRGKGDYQMIRDTEELPEWQKKLSDDLYDNIPGLREIYFSNGEITLQHVGVFEDEELIEEASKIIEPYLTTNLKLEGLK